jgi:ankyrin repeat protein
MNNTRMVRMLVEAGADIDTLDLDGNSALHFAARNGNVEMLRLLKAAGSWLHTSGKGGHTALHFAVFMGRAPAVREVLSWRAIDVNAKGNQRMTALHIAAASGFLEVAELLIDAGADVNAVMEVAPGVEATVLQVAAKEVVPLLLEAGANAGPLTEVLPEAL